MESLFSIPCRLHRRRSSPFLRLTDQGAFEVIGIPIPRPGFYVVELESRILGNALLGKDTKDVCADDSPGDEPGGAFQVGT